jgi:sugar phosphate isomerase/epimerase
MRNMVTEASSKPNSACAPTPILISLSAFGAAEVRRHGQAWFSQLALDAGADGVEVRSELLVDAPLELPAIAELMSAARKGVVYSSAEPLWRADGQLDLYALERAIEITSALGAMRLKMSIGGFSEASQGSLVPLKIHLRQADVELVIENDQTPAAGTLAAMQDFFHASNNSGFPVGMTFDMGNWHWTGECPLQAATALAPQVRYVHCKGVQRLVKNWVAVPLTQSQAPWRAVLRALPANVPWAIEYPLVGDDLLALTRSEITQLRQLAADMAVRSQRHHETLAA